MPLLGSSQVLVAVVYFVGLCSGYCLSANGIFGSRSYA